MQPPSINEPFGRQYTTGNLYEPPKGWTIHRITNLIRGHFIEINDRCLLYYAQEAPMTVAAFNPRPLKRRLDRYHSVVDQIVPVVTSAVCGQDQKHDQAGTRRRINSCSSEIIEFYSDRVIVNKLVRTGAFAQGDKITMCIVLTTQYFRIKIGSLIYCFQNRMRARLFFGYYCCCFASMMTVSD